MATRQFAGMIERIIMVVVYVAAMLAISWLASLFVPGAVAWLDDALGMWAVRAMMFIFVIGCFTVAYWVDWRHPAGKDLDA